MEEILSRMEMLIANIRGYVATNTASCEVLKSEAISDLFDQAESLKTNYGSN